MIHEVPHYPGVTAKRSFAVSGYSPLQEALWAAYADMYYSRAFGYDKTRKPRYNTVIDFKAYSIWYNKFLSAHKQESYRDEEFTRAFEDGDISKDLLMYFYQSLLFATIRYSEPMCDS